MPLHVVASVVDHDNLQRVGMPAGNYVTQYTYRDAVYDGRQREFRGFRTTVAKRIGDANSPTSSSSSEFLLGECADDEPPPPGLTSRCLPAGRWADNGREALKGLPVVSEMYDDSGVYLSTTHNQYTLRKLYTGLDGREVRVAFESQTDAWNYDTAGFAPATGSSGLGDVVLDQVPGSGAVDAFAGDDPLGAGTAHIRSATTVDLFGNADGAEGERMRRWQPLARFPTRSSHPRPSPSSCPATRAVGSGGRRSPSSKADMRPGRAQGHDFTYDPNANGNLILTQAQLAGSLPLDRFHEAGRTR